MPWQVMENFDSIEDKSHIWYQLVSPIIDKHLPVKRMGVREKLCTLHDSVVERAIRRRKYVKQYAREKNEENKELRNK